MANIFSRIFGRREAEAVQVEERSWPLSFAYNSISSYQTTQSMRLSAVYAAVNMISNSCALLPIKVVKYENGRKVEVKHNLADLLNLAPENRYNHFNWMKLLIESVILDGNGYAFIERDNRLNVKALHLIDPAFVQPLPQPDGTIKYCVQGMDTLVESVNMIHLFQHVDETFRGISTLRYAVKTLESAADTEEHAARFFKSGAGMMGVLNASAPMTNEQKKQAAESWKESVLRNTGVAVLPQGLSFQSIQVDPEDAQLIESRQYNVVEIARFFNISPVKLFDLTNVSYSTLEQTSLSYLQDTVLPFTQLIEDEFNRKLFKPSEMGILGIDFDYSSILTTDKKTEAEYYAKLINNGIMTLNEARQKLGLEPKSDSEAGDVLWMQISYGSADQIAQGAYIKQTAQDQNTQQDNKVKAEEEKPVEEKPKKSRKKTN